MLLNFRFLSDPAPSGLFTKRRPAATRRVLRCTGFALTLSVLAGCGMLGSAPEPGLERGAVLRRPLPPRDSSFLDTLGVVAYAASMQGKPYKAAGSSPHEGFDCSGLVQHVFGRFDLMLPRSAATMAEVLPEIPLSYIEAADLLFFNTQGSRFSHVGIYLGDGRFVHAPSPATGRVIISEVSNQYWRGRVTGARRPQPIPLALVQNPTLSR